MERKDLVTSKDIAKKLRELGIKQNSKFYWAQINFHLNEWDIIDSFEYHRDEYDGYSAFTASELGEMLPIEINKNESQYLPLTCQKGATGWEVGYETSRDSNIWIQKEAHTEADARGKLLIYLIEQKLIAPGGTKKELKEKMG